MNFDYSKLRGRIVEKYGSQSKFSEDLGIAKQTVNSKLNGTLSLTRSDIIKWSEKLDISKEEIGVYFFTPNV